MEVLTHKTAMRVRVEQALAARGVDPSPLRVYDDPRRHYHNWDHIEDVLGLCGVVPEDPAHFALMVAAVFHDAVYVPGARNNEELSARLASRLTASALTPEESRDVTEAILATKDHRKFMDGRRSSIGGQPPPDTIASRLVRADIHNLLRGTPERLFADERKIFLEYQRFPYADYTKGRVEFLSGYADHDMDAVNALLEHVKQRVPRLAVLVHTFDHEESSLAAVHDLAASHDKVILAQYSADRSGVMVSRSPDWEHHQCIPWTQPSGLADAIDPDGQLHLRTQSVTGLHLNQELRASRKARPLRSQSVLAPRAGRP